MGTGTEDDESFFRLKDKTLLMVKVIGKEAAVFLLLHLLPLTDFFPVLPLMGDCIYAVTQGGIAVCINQSVLIGGKKIFGDADVSETALFIGVAVFCA